MGGPVINLLIILLAVIATKVNCQLAVKIEAANKNVTVIPQNLSYLVNMDENNHDFETGADIKILLFKVTGASAKPTVTWVLATAQFTYSIEQDTEGTTYSFYATQSFDYETQPYNYLFNLFVGAAYSVVSFTINNIDDEPPSLSTPQCLFDENTIYTTANSTCTCTVTDPDGWLAKMTFDIVNGAQNNENILFSLEYKEPPDDLIKSATVYVVVNEELDYENVTFYLFNIAAKDGAGHSTTPNEYVRAIVNVGDLPDTPPTWTEYSPFEQFEEQTEQTFRVTAVDGDFGLNWEINYKVLQQDYAEEEYISIDNNGTISVKKIDRDKYDLTIYKFVIMAYEVPDAPLWNNTKEISFYIQDIDNNPPLIKSIINYKGDNVTFSDDEKKITNLTFLENYDGSLNTTTLIMDIDTAQNAQFSVELEDVDDSDFAKAFLIVPTAGYRSGKFELSVRDSSFLDYEDPLWIHIQFNVKTSGTLDPTKQDKMLVQITLEDYNDEVPVFKESQYEIYVNETAKKDVLLIQIMATDADAEDAILRHSLIGSTYSLRVLRIESDTGKIYVNVDNAFDYDTVNPIFVQVQAVDKVDHTTIVPLTINLLDVNNKAPTISPGGSISVEENQKSGVKLNASITASDEDTTADLIAEIDWEKSYAMKNSRKLDMSDANNIQQTRFLEISYTKEQPDNPDNKDIIIDLTISSNNADETTPDFELFDSLFLAVKVTDLNTDPDFMDKQSTTSIILISIIDINDNTPYFPEADLSDENKDNRTVQENAPQSISVGSIVAIDLDVDDTVTYSCKALDPSTDWIAVNKNTGAFTVVQSETIDADTNKTFYFYYSCTASDGLHTSEPLQVGFYIIDTNNKSPVITMDNEINVDEKSPAGTAVTGGDIQTTDDDRDIPFHTVECSFSDLTTPCATSFIIENNVVKVRIGSKDIDRDEGEYTSYQCDITCIDNPNRLQSNPSNSVLKSFTIVLNDINDHTPELLTKELSATENIKKDAIIGLLVAQDIDEGDNAEIDFVIQSIVKSGDENTDYTTLFKLQPGDNYHLSDTQKQNELVALVDLKDQYGTYTIEVKLADRGTPPNTKVYTLTLTIEKFNYYAPEIISPAQDTNYILLSAQELNSPLMLFRNSEYIPDFHASENPTNDICKKWNIVFTYVQLTPSDEDDIFKIVDKASCSAQLQVNDNYKADSVLRKTYTLEITASLKDGTPQEGEASYTTTRNLTINFFDNNEKPIFKDGEREWSFEFRENDISQVQELKYKASYENVESQSLSIFYFLVADENNRANDFFTVNQATGAILLKKELDYETDESFKFQIVATNDTNPVSDNPYSYAQVTCNVIDINDNTPQWTKQSFFGAIMAGYIRNTPILTLEATDADKIDEGKLTYKIDGEWTSEGSGLNNIPSEPFLITETTGEVRLNFQVDATMTGHFTCTVTVSDVEDQFGNGPHTNTTSVVVFIITSGNIVDFRFYNTIDEVQQQEDQMLLTIGDILHYNAYKQNIDKQTEDGVELDQQTYASLYFINSSTVTAESETILRLVSNMATYSLLVSRLRNETGLILQSFPSTNTNTENLEVILKAWLIGVSVVLGALCMILLVVFILKTRELNNRITNLTTTKFGSQESGLNRMGISAPTTNKHALEGSNPMFTTGEIIKKDLAEYDDLSIRSGDSDLIGIEDSPDFDYKPQKANDISHYM